VIAPNCLYPIDTDSSRKLREEFAKSCFETLLQFSFISPEGVSGEGSITKLAVTALLQRCQEVLQKYVEDERLSGKCPLPRYDPLPFTLKVKIAFSIHTIQEVLYMY
jgi:hypothetical protein